MKCAFKRIFPPFFLICACLLMSSGTAQAALADNSLITIMPSSTPAYYSNYQSNALDTGADRYVTDYAANTNSNVHLDFDFGAPLIFISILYTDRTTSGGPNGRFNGGTFDFVTSYKYTFSNNSDFSSPVGTFTTGTLSPPSSPSSYLDFQSNCALPGSGYEARYVRWEVLSTVGTANYPGAADFQFTVVPIPAAFWLFGFGLTGLFGIRRKIQKLKEVDHRGRK